MATIPQRQVIPQGVVKNAISADGKSTRSSVQSFNQISGDNELQITLSIVGAVDATNIPLFFGGWVKDRTLDNKVTFASPNFGSATEFYEFFRSVSTKVIGMRMQTNNVENFQSILKFISRNATGKTDFVTKLLSRYRVPVGNGYSETIELSEEDLTFLLQPGLQMELSKLKAESYLDIYFTVTGQNTDVFLAPMSATTI